MRDALRSFHLKFHEIEGTAALAAFLSTPIVLRCLSPLLWHFSDKQAASEFVGYWSNSRQRPVRRLKSYAAFDQVLLTGLD